MHAIKAALIFWTIVSLYACNHKNGSKGNSLNDSLAIKWQLDTNACLGYRSIKISDSLIQKYKLSGKSIDSVKLVLGNPGDQYKGEGNQVVFRYYLSGDCPNNNETDHCRLDIFFFSDRFDSFGYTCL